MLNRRTFLKSLGAAAAGVALPWKPSDSLEGRKKRKTNFIQFLADDQGWGDLHSFGSPFIRSPNIDRLAREGIKFTNCYSADSVCSPSRSSILTGRTPFRNGVYRWIPPHHFCHLRASEVTLPRILRDAGYTTAHFGKWHLNWYDEKRDKARGRGQYKDFVFGTPGQPGMNDYGYDWWIATGNVARPNHKDPENFFRNGEPLGKVHGFSAQFLASQFVKWFKEERDKDKPFFVTFWFHEPHGPINADPRFTGLYRNLKDPSLRQFLGSITEIDTAVGTIVRCLKEEGVYEDTLIWYTSDNGPEGRTGLGTFNRTDSPYDGSRYRGSTGGLRGRKRHTHEGGIRVPGIICWPRGLREAGIRPGGLSGEPIIGSDVFPTFLEVAGLPLPEGVTLDGTSILPILRGKKFRRPRPLYWRNHFFQFRIASRDGDWKILGNSRRTKFELFNLRLDPRETTDLSAHEPERFERMKKALIAYDKEVLAEGPKWWRRDKKIAALMPPA